MMFATLIVERQIHNDNNDTRLRFITCPLPPLHPFPLPPPPPLPVPDLDPVLKRLPYGPDQIKIKTVNDVKSWISVFSRTVTEAKKWGANWKEIGEWAWEQVQEWDVAMEYMEMMAIIPVSEATRKFLSEAVAKNVLATWTADSFATQTMINTMFSLFPFLQSSRDLCNIRDDVEQWVTLSKHVLDWIATQTRERILDMDRHMKAVKSICDRRRGESQTVSQKEAELGRH